jgi:hypothetical protein
MLDGLQRFLHSFLRLLGLRSFNFTSILILRDIKKSRNSSWSSPSKYSRISSFSAVSFLKLIKMTKDFSYVFLKDFFLTAHFLLRFSSHPIVKTLLPRHRLLLFSLSMVDIVQVIRRGRGYIILE